MPVFVIEREFAEQFELNDEIKAVVSKYEDENEIKWITSFLSADRKKTYCLYECDDVEMLRRHASDLGLPADVITQVDELVR